MKAFFSASAIRQLSKLEKSIQKRIINKVEWFISQTNALSFGEKIGSEGLGAWRFRVGDYRVLFDVKSDAIIILKIGHRRDVYR